MNTPSTPFFAPAAGPAFHESMRTALSTNTDPLTGRREQTMTTSRMELAWVAGELRITCKASRVQMDATRDRQRSGAPSARGG